RRAACDNPDEGKALRDADHRNRDANIPPPGSIKAKPVHAEHTISEIEGLRLIAHHARRIWHPALHNDRGTCRRPAIRSLNEHAPVSDLAGRGELRPETRPIMAI